MAQFLRAMEAKLIAYMSAGEGDLLEQLVVRSGLTLSEVGPAISSLERRGLVTAKGEGRYALTENGVKARTDSISSRDSRRGYTPVFLLDDDVEETANSASQEELDLALDRELGPREKNLGE